MGYAITKIIWKYRRLCWSFFETVQDNFRVYGGYLPQSHGGGYHEKFTLQYSGILPCSSSGRGVVAGIGAAEGLPASRYAMEASAEQGINLRFHRSRPLTRDLIECADPVLTMEKAHADFIKRHWPETKNGFVLKQYGCKCTHVTDKIDIADPISGGLDDYRKTFDELRKEIVRISSMIFPLIRDTYSLS